LGADGQALIENPEGDPLGVMTIAEVAAILGRKPKTIQNWVARREIPFVILKGRTVFIRESVREWLREKETKSHGSY
jgi:excisionase family DNA binding protein